MGGVAILWEIDSNLVRGGIVVEGNSTAEAAAFVINQVRNKLL